MCHHGSGVVIEPLGDVDSRIPVVADFSVSSNNCNRLKFENFLKNSGHAY